jgi:hypothetical protein
VGYKEIVHLLFPYCNMGFSFFKNTYIYLLSLSKKVSRFVSTQKQDTYRTISRLFNLSTASKGNREISLIMPPFFPKLIVLWAQSYCLYYCQWYVVTCCLHSNQHHNLRIMQKNLTNYPVGTSLL